MACVTDYTELSLSDGTSVRLEVVPAPPPDGGFGGVSPVGRGPSSAALRAAEAARTVLRPLGPLLQEVHDAVSSGAVPPDEISVQFGVQVGQDLKLGIVGANGQASLTISATWRMGPDRTGPADRAGAGAVPGTGTSAGTGGSMGAAPGAGRTD
ncbi:CU044_2847 family protein [Streptomyces sp. XD-27]|uniref:CU044_2847 family protein n=1 Tax=Streptomyces sp. XD-27 TaxID=3062779 RepID=UPI00350E3BA6